MSSTLPWFPLSDESDDESSSSPSYSLLLTVHSVKQKEILIVINSHHFQNPWGKILWRSALTWVLKYCIRFYCLNRHKARNLPKMPWLGGLNKFLRASVHSLVHTFGSSLFLCSDWLLWLLWLDGLPRFIRALYQGWYSLYCIRCTGSRWVCNTKFVSKVYW